MFLYKSPDQYTVSVWRYQVTADPGVQLDEADEELDALVKEGKLLREPPLVEEPTKPVVPPKVD